MILSFAREAGGAEAIAPVVKILKERYPLLLLAKDYAKDVFNNHGLSFREVHSPSNTPIKKLIEKYEMPSLILTSATSLPWNDMTEKLLWEWGMSNRVSSIAVLDNWQYYALRFSGVKEEEHLKYLPDYICVMDEHAKREMVAEGIPASRIVITGQPAFDSIVEYKKMGREKTKEVKENLGIKNEKLILFVSEALYRDFGYTLGYTESTTLQAVLKVLSKLRREGFTFTLAVKLHPQNLMEDFSEIDFRKYNLNIKFISREINPRALILSSDVVIGMASILLIESILLNKPTLSLQMNSKNSHLIATKIGAIPLISSIEKFEKIMRLILTDAQSLEKYLSAQRKMNAEELATPRVVSLIEKILSNSQTLQ